MLELWREADARPSPTDDGGSLEGLRRRDEGALIVAEIEGEVIGAVIAAWDGWRGSLYRLTVHPERRRRGAWPERFVKEL